MHLTRDTYSACAKCRLVSGRVACVTTVLKATLAGGWGASERDGRQWARGLEEGGSDQDVRAAATTSFSLAFNWQGMLSEIEGMPNTW